MPKIPIYPSLLFKVLIKSKLHSPSPVSFQNFTTFFSTFKHYKKKIRFSVSTIKIRFFKVITESETFGGDC